VVRTIITLEEDDKQWLDARAAAEGVPMAALIRRAVAQLRGLDSTRARRSELLATSSGLGSGEDGLAQQRRLRNEWSRRSP